MLFEFLDHSMNVTLNWYYYPECKEWAAEACGRYYTITIAGDRYCLHEDDGPSFFDSLGKAKAAAQADCDRRAGLFAEA